MYKHTICAWYKVADNASKQFAQIAPHCHSLNTRGGIKHGGEGGGNIANC